MWKIYSKNLFLICLFGYLGISTAYAKLQAMVKSEKAIVYADSELTSPIGWVKRGKELTLSSKPHKSGKVYLLIVNRKYAYIQSKDIYLLDSFGKNSDSRKRRNSEFK